MSVRAQAESAQLPFTSRDLPNRAARAARGGDSVEVHVAVRLGGEVDRLAVCRPGGVVRIEAPIHRQVSHVAATDWNDADVVLHSPALRAHERDRLAVRRPRRRAALHETRPERSDRSVGDREQKQCRIRVVTDFPILRRVLLEHDRAALRRPGRRGLAQLATGQLTRCAAGDRHEIQMAGTADLSRRQVAALIGDDRDRGVHAAVKTLRVGSASNRGR